MAQSGDVLWNPVTRTMLTVAVSAADDAGRRLVLDWVVPPGERLVAAEHLHPGPNGLTIETFEVLAGKAGYRLAGRDGQCIAPGTIAIPANAAHIHPWNAGVTDLSVRQTILPDPPDLPLLVGVERFFETLAALSQRGAADRNGNIRGVLQNALSLSELLLGGTYLAKVPKGLQAMALGGLASLARRRGLSAYVEPVRGRPAS
jgi:hypothetical protein